MLEEYSVATVPARKAYYVWGNYIDELLFIWNGDNSSLAAHALQDHLFSTVALVDVTDGTILERCEYNAYGKVSFLNPTTYAPLATQASTVGNPYTFTGRRLDILDNGNYKKYHYRHRDYDADTGRFLQKDPLNYVDGMNLYEYVKSTPIASLDPLGLRLVKLFFAYEYKNANTRRYVPKLGDIEKEIKGILGPCFKGLKCDKVKIKCIEINKDPMPELHGLVIGPSSEKPIMYLQHIFLTDKEGKAKNLAYTNGAHTSIFAKRIDNVIEGMDVDEALKRRQNLHVIFANISVHEAIWLGLLGKIDNLFAEKGTLPSNTANYEPMTITPDECKKIRKKLKVK